MKKKTSGNRDWCKICRVWIADNKAQRQQHEQAKKHCEALRALLAEIARKNNHSKEVVRTACTGVNNEADRGTSSATAELLNSVAIVASMSRGSALPKALDDRESNESKGANVPVRRDELLDSNGFPLPAGDVYGGWRMSDANDKEPDSTWNGAATGGKIGKSKVGAERDVAEVCSNGQQRCEGNPESETANACSAASNTQDQAKDLKIEGIFCRRTAPRTRRMRRKPTPR